MPSAKFVLIGGGSYGWTPVLFTDLCVNPALKGLHVILHDINGEPLRIIVPLCQKIAAATGAQVTVEGTTDLQAALRGADFVGLTISTGGDENNRLDIEIPQRYGIYQTVGDTVGPGGWSRALRNIPVVVDIARKVRQFAPNAWFMNYSNPMTVLTQTLRRIGLERSMGICHELQGLLLHLAYFFGVDWQRDLSCRVAGINHLIWLTKLTVKGRDDGLALAAEFAKDPAHFKKLGPLGVPEELIAGGGVAPLQKVKFDLLLRTGYLAGAGDAHVVEFLPFYISSPEEAARWGFKVGEKAHTFARTEGRAAYRKRCEDMLTGNVPLRLAHSHEHADRIIAALLGATDPLITPLNLPNCGQIDNLPRDAVVETLACVSGDCLQPLATGPLPEVLLAYTMRHVPTQDMIVEAGLTGNRELAILALANDPMISSPDIARKLADDFFTAFRPLLPQFHGCWSL